jgi:VWFA-related protein
MSPNRVLIGCFTLLVALLSSGAIAVAQNCRTCASSQPESLSPSIIEASGVSSGPAIPITEAWTMRKHVDEVYVFFTARKGHKYVDDITADEVKVQDDHQPVAKISSFGRQADLPLLLGLLVDTSDSVQPRFRFEKEASSQFLRKVVRPGIDRAFVMGFSDQPTLTSDYTDDPRQLAAGVSALNSGGGTALFDAVVQACEKLASVEEDRPVARMLVLLSDGEENSSYTTLQGAIEFAQRRDVTIYSISLSVWVAQRGDLIMKRLGVETGGEIFNPNNSHEMGIAFSSIDRQMRSRYALSYHPKDLVEDGRYREIEVIAKRSNKRLHVKARKGYYAPLAESVN